MANPIQAVPDATPPERIPYASQAALAKRKVVELPMQPLTPMALPWVVSSVLQEHDLGQFQRSALLWEQMRRDDRVAATMSVRINALMGLEHDFSPAAGTTAKDAAVEANSEAMSGVWKRFSTPAERVQILSWGLGLGFAFGRLDWEYSKDVWMPKLSVWHPSFVSWRTDLLQYHVSTANAGVVPITPGVDGWWLWTPFGFKRGWAEGYVHKLATPWLARTWAYRDWCRYNEMHGLPMVKAYIPMQSQDDDEARFLAELANRGTAPVVRLPKNKDNNPGYDFELVEAKADTWEAFQGMKQDANTDIAVAVLGQNLTTEVQGGSFAAAKVQDKVRGDILDADARAFEAWFDEAIGLPYAAVNLPGGEDSALALRFQTQETDDLLKAGEGLSLLGDGITKAVSAGVKLDVDEVTRRVDVPTTGPWEKPEAPVAPAAAPPGGSVPPGKLDAAARPPNPLQGELAASEGETPTERAARLGLPSARSTQEQGQAYADAIVAHFTKQGGAALNEDRLKVLSAIMSAESFEEMQHLLRAAYAEMDATALSELLATASQLAELNGWFSARGA